MLTKTLRLFPADYAALQALAVEMDAIAPTGPYRDTPSWRTLIREIARGTLRVERLDGAGHQVADLEDKGSLEQRPVRYSQEDFAALQALAVEMDALAPTGPRHGQPSWRTLVKLIARRALRVSRPAV